MRADTAYRSTLHALLAAIVSAALIASGIALLSRWHDRQLAETPRFSD